MVSVFEKLKENVRDALINAGTKEFSIHGLERCSLNKILTESKVSKGVFYYHFEDKDNFFAELIKYSGHIIIEYLNKNDLLDEEDFINRLIHSMLLKYDLFMKYEYFLDFLLKIYDEFTVERVSELLKDQSFSIRVLTENLKLDMFKDDMPIDTYKKIAGRYINQLSTEIRVHFKVLNKEQVKEFYIKETKELRQLVYKEEYHD